MSIKSTWFRRTVAVTGAVVGAMAVGNPTADAAQTSGTFDVTATVSGSCSIVPRSLAFPGYTTNQSTPVDAATTLDVLCPGASNSYTLPVELKLSTASGAYSMAGPSGAQLTYGLYTDSSRSTPFALAAAAAGATYTVDAATYTVNIYGRINPNQAAPTGSYVQIVTATLTY